MFKVCHGRGRVTWARPEKVWPRIILQSDPEQLLDSNHSGIGCPLPHGRMATRLAETAAKATNNKTIFPNIFMCCDLGNLKNRTGGSLKRAATFIQKMRLPNVRDKSIWLDSGCFRTTTVVNILSIIPMDLRRLIATSAKYLASSVWYEKYFLLKMIRVTMSVAKINDSCKWKCFKCWLKTQVALVPKINLLKDSRQCQVTV